MNESAVRLSCTTDYNRLMHDVVVYSRNGCHLCDVIKETLADFQDKADFHWREVDIC